MASYNAGRSLSHLLTDGAFDALKRDSDGYASVPDAVDQLMRRRRTPWQDVSGSEGREGDDSKRQRRDGGDDSAMRSFLERTVATFGRTRPGRLNRREFARMYDTFLKRPAEFARLMTADSGEDGEAEAAADEATADEAAAGEAADAQAPQMSKAQLRSLVDEVNRRLATEAAGACAGTGAAQNQPKPASAAPDELQLD